MHRTLLAGALVLGLAVAGCRADNGATGPTLSRTTFIEVVVELRQAADTLHTADAYNAERDRILARAGVTDGALVDFVRAHGSEPARMAAIWDSIATRLQRVREEAEEVDPR